MYYTHVGQISKQVWRLRPSSKSSNYMYEGNIIRINIVSIEHDLQLTWFTHVFAL